MTNRYEELRAAAEAATPGPWEVEGDFLRTLDPVELEFERSALADLRYFHMPNDRVNAAFIALANPETIKALLSERDSLLAALKDLRAAFAPWKAQTVKQEEAMRQATAVIAALTTKEG